MNTNILIKTGPPSMHKDTAPVGGIHIAIKPGDTITFIGVGGQANLVFPAHTVAILSPKPAHQVSIDGGQHLVFTVQSAAPGNYCVLSLTMGIPIPLTVTCDQAHINGATLIVKGRADRPTPQPDPDTQAVLDPNPPDPNNNNNDATA